MAVKDLIAKADKEIAADRHWRAKEMLRSSIPNYGYDLTLIRKLADVLMEMKDAPAAGKYLFLSVDEPDERQLEAIEVFLKRFSQNGYRQLIFCFPKRTRMPHVSDYPKFAQEKLRELNAPEDLSEVIGHTESESDRFDWGCWVGLLLALVVLSCTAVGGFQIFKWFVSWTA